MKDISVIIPLYKGKKYVSYWINKIERNMVVVREQEINISSEIIFVNDCPEEEIVLEDYSELSFEVRLISSIYNCGIHGARAKGVCEAEGDFVVFMDQDDYIEDNYLYSQYMKIGAKNGVVCNAHLLRYCMDVKIKKYKNKEDILQVNDYKKYIHEKNPIVSPGQVLLRKESIPKEWISNIMHNNGADDLFLWLLMLNRGDRFEINEEVLYTHVEHAHNTSSDMESMQNSLDELSDILEKKSLVNKVDVSEIRKNKVIKDYKELKLAQIIKIYDKWVYLKNRDISIHDWLLNNGYRKIIIYGMNFLGNRLYDELKINNMEIVAAIDRNAEELSLDIPIVILEQVETETYINSSDLIIVTAEMFYEEIKETIKRKYQTSVISLNRIIDLLLEEHRNLHK